MNRSDITVVILTLNEEENVGRLLECLSWALQVVVVDSGSTDRTIEIVSGFPNVTLRHRAFDTHASQWNAGVDASDTEWVLTLDADHMPSEELAGEIAGLLPASETSAYRATFIYSIFGRPLRGSLYPSLPVLFRRDRGSFYQDGHTNKLRVDGVIRKLDAKIFHDDRKPLDRWLRNQVSYMKLERAKLLSNGEPLSLPDRIRRSHLFAPIYAFVYVLLIKRAILDGKAGFYYAYQRLLAEVLLSLELLDDALRRPNKPGS